MHLQAKVTRTSPKIMDSRHLLMLPLPIVEAKAHMILTMIELLRDKKMLEGG
jgi:hypothetical protein